MSGGPADAFRACTHKSSLRGRPQDLCLPSKAKPDPVEDAAAPPGRARLRPGHHPKLQLDFMLGRGGRSIPELPEQRRRMRPGDPRRKEGVGLGALSDRISTRIGEPAAETCLLAQVTVEAARKRKRVVRSPPVESGRRASWAHLARE